MTRDEARQKVCAWGLSEKQKTGDWFHVFANTADLSKVRIDGTFDFEALLDALDIPR
jgi:hypothetical protein